MEAKSVAKIAGWIALGVTAAAALVFLLGLAVQALWNWLMPAIFGLPAVTYWQAVGLLVLCHLLFKSHYERHGHHAAAARGGHLNHEQPHFIKEKLLKLLGGAEKSAVTDDEAR